MIRNLWIVLEVVQLFMIVAVTILTLFRWVPPASLPPLTSTGVWN